MAWRENKDCEELHSQIDTLLEMEGRGKNAIDLELISTGGDLDRLWGEFLITGNQIAIQKIIDVLEWPDLIRGRLEESLKQRSESQLLTQDSTSALRVQFLNQGIILDTECKSIYSAQDIDCFCVMEGCEISKDRLDTMKLIFPFELSDSDLSYMEVKASAKWSLCSNTMQHEAVLDTCIEDASKRVGKCRLLLLEIISRTYLARDDIERGLNSFDESLTLDPVSRDRQRKRAQEAYSDLLLLDINGNNQTTEAPSDRELTIKECLNTCESLRSYQAKMIWQEQSETPEQGGEIFWELEYAKPDRFRVSQVAGDDFDEWITIGGLHYRGPMFTMRQDQELVGSDLSINNALLMGNYLDVVREVQPDETRTLAVGQTDYVALDYKNLDINRLPLLENKTGDIGFPLMRLWIETGSRLLVKAELLATIPTDNGGPGTLKIIHMFAGYNDNISIFPPPFEIIQPGDDLMEGQEPALSAQALLKGQAPLSLPWTLLYVIAFIAFMLRSIPFVRESTILMLAHDAVFIPLLAFLYISIWRCAWNTDWKGWGYLSRIAVALLAAGVAYELITGILQMV